MDLKINKDDFSTENFDAVNLLTKINSLFHLQYIFPYNFKYIKFIKLTIFISFNFRKIKILIF